MRVDVFGSHSQERMGEKQHTCGCLRLTVKLFSLITELEDFLQAAFGNHALHLRDAVGCGSGRGDVCFWQVPTSEEPCEGRVQ